MSNPLVSTLTHLKGNPRACTYTEPLWGLSMNLCLPYASVYMLALGIRDIQIGLISTIGMVAQVIFGLLGGVITDKIGRRKPFVFWTSVVLAASMVVPLVWPSLPALFIQAIVGFAALGAYMVVDQALFIDVIEDKRTAGRDLGMSALGGNFGQALGPILAGQLVVWTAGYAAVWAVAAAIVLIAALAILPVKRVK